jgi:hypothetical protein
LSANGQPAKPVQGSLQFVGQPASKETTYGMVSDEQLYGTQPVTEKAYDEFN